MINFEKDEREKIEEQMTTVLNQMMELERQIRIGREAEIDLKKYREQLEKLANKYASDYDR
ncbi:hypothetical protein [Tepidanaerobacter syntrophicus]|uniref:hypothetical protein n=1 Tax=Tepidanaerobacter syntrophicus TaxID=224999 RepID=UPI001BD5ADA3|nr:hypothetical protein [Tepidanaerobacter syntrophicus]